MSEQIKVLNGLKTYDFVNEENQLIGQLTFNPSDINILKRHGEVIKYFQGMMNGKERLTGKSALEQLTELSGMVCEKIDYLFDAKVSEVIFAKVGPLSPMPDGKFFFENVMEAIGNIIKQETGQRVEKMNKKISKYTKKYN